MKNSKAILTSTIILASLAILFVGGCKKQNINPVSPSYGKLKTFSHQRFFTDTMFYDSLGRKIRDSNSDGGRYMYYYSPNKASQYYFSPGSTYPTDSAIFTLNSSGYVISSINSADYAVNDGVRPYQYDASWHCSSETTTSGSSVYYVWKGENLDSIINFDSSLITSVLAVTSYTDKPNTLSSNEGSGMTWMGKDSKNLRSGWTDCQNGTGTTTHSCTFEFDSNNRVTKITEISSGAHSGTLVRTFTYYD